MINKEKSLSENLKTLCVAGGGVVGSMLAGAYPAVAIFGNPELANLPVFVAVSVAFGMPILGIALDLYQVFKSSRRKMWFKRQRQSEIKEVEAIHPGTRATFFGKSEHIMLTDKSTGASVRDLKRGSDF